MQVIHMYNVFHGIIAKFIGGPVTGSTLDTATGKPNTETLDVMVPPASLCHGGSPKLTSPKNECILP